MDTPSRTAAIHLPRERWSSHPRFPAQTLLLGSHENFRRRSAHLIAECRKLAEPSAAERLYRRWISAMRSHEGYEEYKLYPYLERRWGVSFAPAQAGHAALHENHAEVLGAFASMREAEQSGEANRVSAATDGLVTALRRHDGVLREHLALEEEMVIPLLLELSPAEFERYCELPLSVLLQELEQN